MEYRTHLVRYRSTKKLKSWQHKGSGEIETGRTWMGLTTSPTRGFKKVEDGLEEVITKTYWEKPLHPEAVLLGNGLKEATEIKNAIYRDSKAAYLKGLEIPDEEIERYDVVLCWEPIV